MEALFHLIFELIKIVILASFYTVLFLIFLLLFNELIPGKNWLNRILRYKRKFVFSSGVIVSIVLYAWMFTYWGNHGFGDSARIPIGNGYVIKNINWKKYAYLDEVKTSDNKQLEMTLFVVKRNKLIGNLDSWFYYYENKYFAFNLRTHELNEFKSKSELDEFVEKNDFPKSETLKSFKCNYRNYWNGWRFWLLP